MKIKISEIIIEKRIRQDHGDIDELAENIKEYGLLSPIILRRLDNGSYKLLAGERRLKAFKLLQRNSIESIIHVRQK